MLESESKPRAERVRGLFDRIARRYDLINDLQSFGMHRRWKDELLGLGQLRPGDRVLDLASGTGDLVARGAQMQPAAEFIALDFSLGMLGAATHRRPRVQADILQMPFRDSSFDAVTIGYGLRNVADRTAALAEMRRVLKPAGRLLILEFAKPERRWVRSAYFLWLSTVQPVIGKLFFQDPATYAYILESLRDYPEVRGVTGELETAGFRDVLERRLWLGSMSIHRAVRG